jgi:hypothetical protein
VANAAQTNRTTSLPHSEMEATKSCNCLPYAQLEIKTVRDSESQWAVLSAKDLTPVTTLPKTTTEYVCRSSGARIWVITRTLISTVADPRTNSTVLRLNYLPTH